MPAHEQRRRFRAREICPEFADCQPTAAVPGCGTFRAIDAWGGSSRRPAARQQRAADPP